MKDFLHRLVLHKGKKVICWILGRKEVVKSVPGSPTTSLKSFDEISSLLLKRVGKPENSRA